MWLSSVAGRVEISRQNLSRTLHPPPPQRPPSFLIMGMSREVMRTDLRWCTVENGGTAALGGWTTRYVVLKLAFQFLE